jgi:hypothetical protein
VKAERKQRIREVLRSVRLHALTAAAACFFATATTGCVSHHGGNAVIESHFTRLEQSCFGYEPTVWRTMSGQCESAVRQIPEPMIQVPKASESTTTPEKSPLEAIPEPGQGLGPSGLFGDLLKPPVPSNDGSVPPTEPAPGAEPMDKSAPANESVPGVEPGTQPAEETAPAEPPTTEPATLETAPAETTSSDPTAEPTAVPDLVPGPEAAEPETNPVVPSEAEPSTAPPPVPQFSFSSARTIETVPVDTSNKPESAQTRKGAANELFRSLESALGEDPQPPARTAKAAPKKGSTGLAKFISY